MCALLSVDDDADVDADDDVDAAAAAADVSRLLTTDIRGPTD